MGYPLSAGITLLLMLLMACLLAKTAFGRCFYATGDNLQGARQLGVRTEVIRILAFSLNGCMAALAGIVFASHIGFIPNQTGTGLEMKAIAACVLGGISLLDLNVLLFSTSNFICIGIVALPLTMVIVSAGSIFLLALRWGCALSRWA